MKSRAVALDRKVNLLSIEQPPFLAAHRVRPWRQSKGSTSLNLPRTCAALWSRTTRTSGWKSTRRRSVETETVSVQW